MIDRAVTITLPEGVPFIEISREFDAPVADLFRAHEEPELVIRWLGPAGYEMVAEEWDLRSGGRYRYTHTDPQGGEWGFTGVFHRVRRNELIIQTFEFEGFADTVSVEVMRLEDLADRRSRLSIHSTYPSLESRDAMAASGMERGITEGYEQLDAVLASL